MRYRVDELAARAGVSVDTVRFYQGRALLPPPRREGRIAWYSDEHARALERIRALKAQGFSLASIRRLQASGPQAAGDALAAAVAGAASVGDAPGPSEWVTLEELSRRTGVSPELLDAVQREGLLQPVERDGERLYTRADAEAVRAGLELIAAGLPLAELLALGREQEDALRRVAERAVELFDEHVRHPLVAAEGPGRETGERLVAAFERVLPAATALVAHHFRRVLLAVARERLQGAR